MLWLLATLIVFSQARVARNVTNQQVNQLHHYQNQLLIFKL
jgi:hypothetical protein